MRSFNKFYFLFLGYFLAICTIHSQEISFELDSIYQTPIENFKKIDAYNKILDKHLENKNYIQLGYDAHKLAKWLYKEKKWDTAIEIVKIACDAREKAIPLDLKRLKQSYYNYANYNRRKGNYAIAIKYFRKLLDLKGSNYLRGRAYTFIGVSYGEIDDLYNSVENHLQAFKYFRPEKDKKHILSNHISLAVTYKNTRTKKSAKQALHHYKKADSIIKTQKKPKPKNLYSINNGIGGIYFEGVGLKDLDKANQYFKKGLKNIESLDWLDYECSAYYNLGITHIKENPHLAENYFKKSLSLVKYDERLHPKIHMGLGMLAFSKKNYALAIKKYQTALEYYFNIKLPNYNALPSSNLLQFSSNKAELLELIKLKIIAHLALAKVKNSIPEYELTFQTVKIADHLISTMLNEQHSFKTYIQWRDLASEIYILGLNASHQINNIEETHYLMERNKALLLIKEINRQKTNIPSNILAREKEIENKIITLSNAYLYVNKHQKDSISEALLFAKNKLSSFNDSLAKQYSSYFSKSNTSKTISINDVNIDNDHIILHYTMAERVANATPEAFLLFLSPKEKKSFKIKKIDSLLENIVVLRKLLDSPFSTEKEVANYQKTAYKIFNTLIPKEIQSKIKGKKITIISDHLLNFIPFEALITNKETNTYFIENNEIHYEYSLSFKKENSALKRNPKNDFLGIAPIEFSQNITTLNNSEKEIVNGNTYYNGTILTKHNASKENFIQKANHYKILHLATHANASDAISPWIAFHDSKMNQIELNTVKTQANLVVLSACNTSLGVLTNGEGVLSLARSFFRSGTLSVISSLWSTNDKATYKITSTFYKNLHEGKTKSEALRAAKLTYINANTNAEASPHYWASLILIGDSGVLKASENNSITYLFVFIFIGIVVFILYKYFLHKNTQSKIS